MIYWNKDLIDANRVFAIDGRFLLWLCLVSTSSSRVHPPERAPLWTGRLWQWRLISGRVGKEETGIEPPTIDVKLNLSPWSQVEDCCAAGFHTFTAIPNIWYSALYNSVFTRLCSENYLSPTIHRTRVALGVTRISATWWVHFWCMATDGRPVLYSLKN